jgi:rare lipoprotein A
MTLASAAHATLPLPSIVEVTNLENDRSIQVRVNDRGPFKPGRIIDVSREAADQLGFRQKGVAQVRVRYVGPAPLEPLLPPSGKPVVLAAAATPVIRVAEPTVPMDSRGVAPKVTLAAKASTATSDRRPELTPAVPAGPSFAVQAGAFSNRGNAERAAQALGAIAPVRVRELTREGGVLYRVLVGAWSAEASAVEAVSAVADAGFPDARVVSAS